MTEHVHVGRHADILASGRHLGPSDRVDSKDLDLATKDGAGQDQHLIDEGVLVPVSSFNSPEVADNQLSGDALKARAQDLDIKGRSGMSVDELRAAVADAEAAQTAGTERS